MQLDFLFRAFRPTPPDADTVQVGGRAVSVVFVRNPRARRYILRLRRDGIARVTVPRAGSVRFARDFLQRSTPWLERELNKRAHQTTAPKSWHPGTEILFRGNPAKLELINDTIHLATERIKIGGRSSATPHSSSVGLRPTVESQLRRLAEQEFPARVAELAARHQLTVKRVTVRDQRTRWGSCSRKGAISLNWRLIQTPPFVLDYLILHELAHIKHMNHSRRYWQEVARMCPDYEVAERWLKAHTKLLR